jgi:hypothetical protein
VDFLAALDGVTVVATSHNPTIAGELGPQALALTPDNTVLLRDASGAPIYSGNVDIDGKGFILAPNAFSYSKAKKQDLLSGLTHLLASSSDLKVSACFQRCEFQPAL